MHISLIPQVLWKARIKDIANETRTTVFKVNKMIYPKQQTNNKKEGINQLQILKKKTIHNDNLQKVVWNNILQKKV